MEIDLSTKVGELLDAYPKLEEELIRINPKFKKLKNPILRRTVAKIATLAQAAKVGGMDPVELVNLLRKAVGQPPLQGVEYTEEESEAPVWIATEPKALLDANELLDSGKNPLAEITKLLKNAKSGDVVQLVADFRPEPLIEEMQKRGYEVYVAQEGEKFRTFIKKP